MKLAIFERKEKGGINALRREGNIPAVLCAKGKTPRHLYLKGEEFQAILRKAKVGVLSTQIFELQEGEKRCRAIVKEIQYHPATYAVLHVDFVEVLKDQPITVQVPIQILGAAECPGVKLGGMMRQIIRSLKVRCLPEHIPSELNLDITAMEIGHKRRLSDLPLLPTMKPLAKLNEVVVVIAKKAAA